MNDVFLLLGTNIGNRLENLTRTITQINERIGEIIQVSSVYETSAWGLEDQPNFLNMVIQIKTDLLPNNLLYIIKKIESDIGRLKREKWGPREIDIDILYYDDLIVDTEELKIPHPGIPDRTFTLIPLKEIAGELKHPILKNTSIDLLNRTKDQTEVSVYLTSSELKDLIPLPLGESS